LELVASFLGALIGGAFALLGGWYALKWQAEREARVVAAALLAELSTAQKMLDQGMSDVYSEMLDHWKSTGEIADRQMLVDIFDNQPQDTLPVYYSMAGKLGLLPQDLAVKVVEYHAGIIGLTRTIVRFLGQREQATEIVKALAFSVEAQFHRAAERRAELITELAAFSTPPREPREARPL
jgi:hypothetical protein